MKAKKLKKQLAAIRKENKKLRAYIDGLDAEIMVFRRALARARTEAAIARL